MSGLNTVSYLGFSRACGSSRARPAGFFSASSWVSNSSSASTLPCVRIATKKGMFHDIAISTTSNRVIMKRKITRKSVTNKISYYGVISRNYFIPHEISGYYDFTSVSNRYNLKPYSFNMSEMLPAISLSLYKSLPLN